MGFSVRDYLVTVEWTGNRYFEKEDKMYKIYLIKGCATLNELNKKIYEQCKLRKSQWEITKIEKLKSNVEIIE